MRHLPAILLGLLILAAFATFAVWALYEGQRIGGGWAALLPILPYVIGGVCVVGALAGALMWLAFYSSRHGYDEPYDVDNPRPVKRR